MSRTSSANRHGSKWIRPEKRAAIYRRDGHRCVWCHSTARLGLDHLVPRVFGGGNQAENLVTSCLRCNSIRKDLSAAAWFKVVDVDPRAVAALVRRPLVVFRRFTLPGDVGNDAATVRCFG